MRVSATPLRAPVADTGATNLAISPVDEIGVSTNDAGFGFRRFTDADHLTLEASDAGATKCAAFVMILRGTDCSTLRLIHLVYRHQNGAIINSQLKRLIGSTVWLYGSVKPIDGATLLFNGMGR